MVRSMSNTANHQFMKLGKKPPKHDPRTLLLADYLTGALTPPPAKIDWSGKVKTLGMMVNDTVGDCTCAAAGHLRQIWTANNGAEITAPDSAILKAYEDISGYTPGKPDTDTGCVELDVLNYWRKTGIGGDKIFGYVALELGNKTHVQLAIDMLGGCTIGLQLPLSAQRQSLWSVVGGSQAVPGSWGGHEVALIAYDAATLTCVTWGKLLKMTWSFFSKYCDEAYGVLSQDWAAGAKVAPSGFTFAQLQADLTKIG